MKRAKLIILIILNQQVGPADDVVTKLSSFLVTLACNAYLWPFDILDWMSMDTKKYLWNYTMVLSFQYLISSESILHQLSNKMK